MLFCDDVMKRNAEASWHHLLAFYQYAKIEFES
jgi:hypothetical protein